MAHFESDTEVYEELGGILRNLLGDADRLEQLRRADAVVQFAFRAPDATVTLDARAGQEPRVDLGATELRPEVVLAMDADTGRALLLGELSPTLALARGAVATKGPVAKVLRVVPATAGAGGVAPAEAPEAAEAEPEGQVEPEAQAEGDADEASEPTPEGAPEPAEG